MQQLKEEEEKKKVEIKTKLSFIYVYTHYTNRSSKAVFKCVYNEKEKKSFFKETKIRKQEIQILKLKDMFKCIIYYYTYKTLSIYLLFLFFSIKNNF